MDNKKTGEFILKLRQSKNLTQKELADKIGVTDKAISKWERGNGLPDVTLLEPLAKALDTSVAELLNGEAIPETDKEQTDSAIVQALEHYKRSMRQTAGIWLIIIGVIILCIFALSIAGQRYYLEIIFGVAALIIGTFFVATKRSLAYSKVPKSAAQWISFGVLAVTLVLEALPYGVVAIFANGPEESDQIVKLYSYFDLLPFAYGEFPPLVTAILTVTLIVMSFVLIIVKKPAKNAPKAQFTITVVAAIVSVITMLYGEEYITIIGVFVTLLLITSAIFCAIANAKRSYPEG